MPNISIDKIIGQTLIAKKNVALYDFGGNVIGVVTPGNAVGTVFSYITKPKFWYMFYPNGDTGQKPYFTQAYDSSVYEKTNAVVKAGIEAAADIAATQAAADASVIEAQGIEYYFSKYGKILVISILAGFTINALIKKQWK